MPLITHGGMKCGTLVELVVQFFQSRGHVADYLNVEAPAVYGTHPSSIINELQAQGYVAAICEQEPVGFALVRGGAC